MLSWDSPIHLSTLVMFEFEWGTILGMDETGSQKHAFPFVQKLPACMYFQEEDLKNFSNCDFYLSEISYLL